MSRATRIYVPLDASRLKTLEVAKALSANDIRGYAVTGRFRSAMPPSEDEEGLEYAVLQDAAAFAAASGARVVAAADIDDLHVNDETDDDDPARVRVDTDVPLRRFASLHVLDPAGERDPDADLELSWYDITELGEVRRVVG